MDNTVYGVRWALAAISKKQSSIALFEMLMTVASRSWRHMIYVNVSPPWGQLTPR